MRSQSLNLLLLSGPITAVWVTACVILLIGFGGVLSWVVVAMFAFFIYSSFMLWRTALKKRLAPLELMFWFYHTNFLFLPALSQSFHRTFYWSTYDWYQPNAMLLTCGIIAIGLSSFEIGIGISQRRTRRESYSITKDDFLSRPIEATWETQVVLFVIMAGLAFFVSMMGITFFTSGRAAIVVESLVEFGILMSLPRAAAAGVMLFSAFLFIKKIRCDKKFNVGVFMTLLAALGLNAIINYPLSIPRFWFFGLIISLMWIISPLRSIKWRTAFIIGMTAMQFTVFPWYSQVSREKGLIGYDMESIRLYLQHGDFDGFQSIVNSIIYINDRGFELGRNLISVGLFFVPRAVWENKAQPLGMAASDFMGYEYTSLSSSIYGELFADFGWISLILCMGIIGYAIRLFDNYYDILTKKRWFGIGALLISVLSGYLIILLRGSLLAVAASIIVLFSVLVISSCFAGRARHRNYIFKSLAQRQQP
ncbi:MAG: hypothetical protein ABFD29_08585 [Anaerolineaceae bacterium]